MSFCHVEDSIFSYPDTKISNIRLLNMGHSCYSPVLPMYSREEAILCLKSVLNILEDNVKKQKI